MEDMYVENLYKAFVEGKEPFNAIRREANSIRDSEPNIAAQLFQTGAENAEKILQTYGKSLNESQLSGLMQTRTAFYQAAADILRDNGDLENAIKIYRQIGSESEAKSIEKRMPIIVYKRRF